MIAHRKTSRNVALAQENGQQRWAFIPAWLDASGLKPSSFRVYCHLSSRMNWKTNRCFCSVREIAETCRLNKDTVAKAVAELEAAGYIQRYSGKARREVNTYRILIPSSITPSISPLHLEEASSDLSEKEGEYCPEVRVSAVRKEGSPMYSREGTPLKVSPLTPPRRGKELHDPAEEEVFDPEFAERIEIENPDISPGALQAAMERTLNQIAAGKKIHAIEACAVGLARHIQAAM